MKNIVPIKILFLSHVFAPGIGGIESSSQFLIDTFLNAGHEVRLVTMQPGGGNTETPFPIIRCPSWSELVKQHQWAEVVFENNPCVRLGWPKLFFGKPSIVVLHTWLTATEGHTIVSRLKTAWLTRAEKVVAISEALRERCWPKALLIGNSYDDKIFNIQPAIERKKNFVFVGRLVSDKGVDLAIRAFAKMLAVDSVSELATATFTIIGVGPDREMLESLAASLLPLGRVRFVGSLRGATLAEELNRHSYQFIPSTWREPFGIVALEGIACGLIPIVSDGGGLPYAVGEAGVVFRRGQLDSLVETTRQLLASPEQQQKCLLAAPAHLAEFNQVKVTRQFVELVEAVGRSVN